MKPALLPADFSEAATLLGCSVAAVRAVCEVEAPRGGFNPDGTPVTLFEGHKFWQFTGGKFKVQAPDLCYPQWTRKHYGKDWQAEKDRLDRACKLDREAALQSASWGRFQIMGFNHHVVGHDTIQKFVNAMYAGEREQLLAFCRYVLTTGLAGALRRCDWTGFARGFNGPRHAENGYAPRIAAAFDRFEKGFA